MRAKKENKVYRIETESEKQRYLKEGFDIYDEDGKILEYSPKKKIAYGEYVKLQEENAALKEEIKELGEKGENPNDEQVIAILKAYAEEKGIDLGRTTTVSGIVKKFNNPGAGDE